MIEFLREALSSHNLPATILLGLVVIYWFLVILGAVDMDLEVDADIGDSGDVGGTMFPQGALLVPELVVEGVSDVASDWISRGFP